MKELDAHDLPLTQEQEGAIRHNLPAAAMPFVGRESGLSRRLSEQYADEPQCLVLWSQALAWESEFVAGTAQKEELLALSQQLLDRASQSGWDTRPEQAFVYLQKTHATGNEDYEAAIQLGTLGLCLFRELGIRRGEAAAGPQAI